MKITLQRCFFSEKEKVFAEHGGIKIISFKFSNGTEALKITNTKGFITVLPFKGQQVWRAEFCGHPLTMKTMFDEPTLSDNFLKTYGAFLIHCGLTAIGNPSPEDTHLQHGELPNAAYEKAYITLGEDECGKYAELSGEYDFIIGFEVGYSFRPHCRLYENGTILHIHNDIINLRSNPLEYFYLCHINFKPVDGAEMIYSAKKENIFMHKDIPENMPKLEEYMGRLDNNILIHNKIDSSSQYYQPEIVFTVKYEKDEDGRGYCLQVLPDKYACMVSHHPDQLPFGIRWISRGEDEDALGMLLPATAEHHGYIDCMKKGFAKYIEPKGKISLDFQAGLLEPDQTVETIQKINKII